MRLLANAARRRLAERSTIPRVLAVSAFVLAFLQRPGKVFTDSRIELTADPTLFLHRITAIWSPTTDLGHIQSGQFIGYLFPMAPWFAFARWLGISMWVAERLWMGSLLALSAWGAVRLMDELYGRKRGLPHLVAGVIFAVNPYVVTFASRATVALLAHVALPWLIIAAHRGMAQPRSWKWPAVFGLVLACAGGGVNAALLPWIVAAPVGLVLYEWLFLERTRGDAWGFAWRTAICALLGAAWWLIPVALQSVYGANFLSFLEQPTSIWATPSMSESFRLLGYWIFYFGTSFRGFPSADFEDAGIYLFDAWVIVATFVVPLVALGGLRLLRRWRFAPYFLALAIFALLVMAAGFPEGKPLERLLNSAYYNLTPIQLLRTTYKAAPLLALCLACLGGAATHAMIVRARARRFGLARRWFPAWLLLGLLAVPVLYGLPLFTGKAIDGRLEYEIPSYWRQALSDANRTTPAGKRLMILPGQLYAWYSWGQTVSSIAPAITNRPVLVRDVLRYADPRASQLLSSVDDLVQQSRVVPGQLLPLLRLMAVGQVLVPADGRPDQSGEADPASVSRALGAPFAPNRAAQNYGLPSAYYPEPGRGGAPVTVPQLRRYRLAGPVPGIVRLQPRNRPVVMDGDAEGVTALAGVGLLPDARALFYAGDLNQGEIVAAVRRNAELVLTDSNRRRFVSGVRMTENRGPTLGPTDPIPPSLPSYDLFARRGSADQTVATYTGLRYLRSPASISFALFPQYRPYAAFDGRLDTTWLVSNQDPRKGYLDLALTHPRAVPFIRLHPHLDALGRPIEVGLAVNGGSQRTIELHRGWNTVPVHAAQLSTLRLRILKVSQIPFAGLGGFDEIEIPGVRVRESLRLPVLLANETRGMDLTRNDIDVGLERTTADYPYRAGNNVTNPQAENRFDVVDAEPGLERTVTLPAARTFTLGGWASVEPAAPDYLIDQAVGMSRAWHFDSSSRFEGTPGQRASSAFDGNSRTAWVGDSLPGRIPWIEWNGPRTITLRQFRLVAGNSGYGFPTRVRIRTPGRRAMTAPVRRDGRVEMPRALRTRRARIEILGSRTPSRRLGVRLLRAVAIAEIRIRGLRAPAPRRVGSFTSRCGVITATAGSARATIEVSGSVAALDAGKALAMRGCGNASEFALGRGANRVSIPPGPLLRADHVRLVSPGARSGSPLPGPDGTVLSQGTPGDGSRTGARLNVTEPSWLVLGESYSSGWRAYCRGMDGKERDLGAPVPIDGFANGWPASPGCRTARFAFAPQGAADASFALSIVASLAMLAILLVPWLRRMRSTPLGRPYALNGHAAALQMRLDASVPAWAPASLDPPRPSRSVRPATAILVGLTAGAVGGFVFAWRAGLVIGLAWVVAILVGISVRRLLALAALGMTALPVLYVVDIPPDLGGFFFPYAQHYIAAHWVAVGVFTALTGALVLWLVDLRGRRQQRTQPPTRATPEAREPSPSDRARSGAV